MNPDSLPQLPDRHAASPCCVPTKQRLAQLSMSRIACASRWRATNGSLHDMVRLDGSFRMGSESPEAFPNDGEGPVRCITLRPFYISRFAVTNAQFEDFVSRTGYRTEAEGFGWSFVFDNHAASRSPGAPMPGTPWWVRVDGADWRHPDGPDHAENAGRANRAHR